MSTAAVISLVFNLLVANAYAQVKLSLTQVKEITIHNTVAGLGGSTSADIKVVAEAGQWCSYLTRKTNYQIGPGQTSYDSTLHELIAVLHPALLNNLLNGIAVIKPTITPATFKLTSGGMINRLKGGVKLPVINAPDFNNLITQKAIDDAIASTVVEVNVTDDFEYCDVNIITLQNDTVKLSTRNLCPTKLPWTLNKHITYDMAINNFVVAATGQADVPNKQTLNIASLEESIYKYIDERTPGAPIATFKWKYDYPVNLKLLTRHFAVTESHLYGNVYSCWLKSNMLPANAVLESWIDMTRKEDVDLIIKYSALIAKYFKTGNFVFNYYSNRPGSHIAFAYYTGHSPYHSLRYLGKKLPELARTDSTQVINFGISEPDDSSSWMIFPDNKVLLTYHSVSTPHGETAPIYPPQDPNANWIIRSETFYLFDGTGKILKSGRGFY